jgi:hypothetical protein
MNRRIIIAVCFVVLSSMAVGQYVSAQPSQVSTAVNLSYLTVELTYPSEVLPGQSATISVQANAKDYFRLVKLVLQVYYADGNNLKLLTTATVASDVYLSKSNQLTKDVQAAVPADAPRTSLVAIVSENVKTPYYDYYPYSYFYYGAASNPYFYYVYPPYYYLSVTDDALAPLSYVKATTPEYVSLQTEYQMLEQKLNQTQADNHKLQQDLQAAQSSVAQKDSMIADLNKQLTSAQTMIGTLGAISVIFAGIAVGLGFFHFRGRIKRPKQRKQGIDD